ncbi:MAG TPA: histidine phosphatase family protein [Mariniphaga sp.]|nr:histidine phosphatase family protein [Mariniphaga sp.]
MKRIILVRHAKAVGHGYDDDINRDLRESGIIDAQKVSKELLNRGIVPDKIITSPALRAIKTAHIFADTFGYDKSNIRKIPDIYSGLTTDEFIEILKKLPKELKSVFFFGHNPDFEYFAQNLMTGFMQEVPTCAAIVIEFDIEIWEKIAPRTGMLALRVVPKELE